MCGIAGIVSSYSGHEALVSRMVAALHHRGPDGSGILAFPGCTLGHTRLSIIDIASGSQPMRDQTGEIAISFNGEIYGYRALREEIDYPYRTHSDTEVILAAHAAFGAGFVEKLKGMFAFALWNNQKGELLLARDRFGEKPLYYALGKNGELLFASEIKAILATGLVDRAIDQESLAHYLQYLTTPVGRSIYRNIHELPPAHQLLWHDGAFSVKPYWALPEPACELTLSDATERFRELLQKAVCSQLVADVEVGAFLSGGLDSTTVCLEAVKSVPALQTISYGFAGKNSELPYAKAVATMLGTRHHELEDDVAIGPLLLKMAMVFDEPFADSSCIPTYRICEFASRNMKVVLSGDGADELLGGYDGWYKPLAISEENRTLFALPGFLPLMRLVFRLLQPLPQAGEGALANVGRALRLPGGSLVSAHYRQRQYFSSVDVSALCGISPKPVFASGHSLDSVLRADTLDYLPCDILRKVDRTAMANSLEVRAPFLDVDLASFLLTLPAALKVTGRESKILLRHAYASQWPEQVRNRGKMGFGAPVAEWLLRPDVADIRRGLFSNPQSAIYRYLDPVQVGRYGEKGGYTAWILLVFAIWAEQNG